MTDLQSTRTELLAVLSEIGRLRPEWRLGQTMANVAMMAGRTETGAVWELEDEEALIAAQQLLQHYATNKKVAA